MILHERSQEGVSQDLSGPLARPAGLPGEPPLLTAEEMAAAIQANPGWLLAQVEAGLIPVVRADGQLWFWPDVVKPIVAAWEARCCPVVDRRPEPLPPVRMCEERGDGRQPEAERT